MRLPVAAIELNRLEDARIGGSVETKKRDGSQHNPERILPGIFLCVDYQQVAPDLRLSVGREEQGVKNNFQGEFSKSQT